MEDLIRSHKVLVCAGSGGVGKTTISASLGVLAAQSGKKVLVLTIDPARRLASALGLTTKTSDVVRVPGQNFSGELFCSIIDPETAFADFIRESARDPETVKRILANPLYRQLSTRLSGSQEFTSLDRLYKAVSSREYDLVILDTPPAQHAIDFLSAPEKIFALFNSSVTKWFMNPPERQNLLQKIVNRGTQTVLSAFEKITGAEFIGELVEFFRAVQGIQDKISARSVETQKLLVSPECGFVLVTGFDEVKLQEASEFYSDLKRGGFRLSSVIVNRAFPLWLDASRDKPEVPDSGDFQKIKMFYEKFQTYYADREKAYAAFQQKLDSAVQVLRLPDLTADLVGLKNLEELAQEMLKRSAKAKR